MGLWQRWRFPKWYDTSYNSKIFSPFHVKFLFLGGHAFSLTQNSWLYIQVHLYINHWPSLGQSPPSHVILLWFEPEQVFPPFTGAGLLQLLVFVFLQSLAHEDQEPQEPQFPSIGQSPPVHDASSSVSPGQSRPPFLGGGLSQLLVLVFLQLLPHVDQDSQLLQLPSTKVR